MAWLEGLVKGFNERRIDVATENERRAQAQNALEQKVFSSLLGSDDEELRALGFNELLKSASGPKKKGGLRGWLGEYQDSGAMDRVRNLINTPVRIAGLQQRQLQPQYQIGMLPGSPTTPAQAGSAATPSQSSVEGGPPPGPTPVGTTGTADTGPYPRPPAEPPTGTVPESLAEPEPPPLPSPDRPVFPAAPSVARPAGATGAARPFGELVAGPDVGKTIPRQVFLSPREREERDLELESRKDAAKRQGEYGFLTGVYGEEEGKDLYQRRYLGSQPREQWRDGGMFFVTESDGQGGVTTRRIAAVMDPKGNLFDKVTKQPLPANAQPVLPGSGAGVHTFVHPITGDVTRVDLNTGESWVVAKGAQPAKPSTAAPRPTTMVGPDGVSRVYQYDAKSNSWVPIGKAPGAAPENTDAAKAQQALAEIRNAIRDEFGDPGNPRNRRNQQAIQEKQQALAQRFGYNSFEELQDAAANARRGQTPDDPLLPRGVRDYVTQLLRKYPGNIAEAQAELVRAEPDLRRDHPNLSWDRVKKLLEQIYAADAAKTRGRGTAAGAGAPTPPKAATPSATETKQMTRAQLRVAAKKLNMTEAQAEAAYKGEGYVITGQ